VIQVSRALSVLAAMKTAIGDMEVELQDAPDGPDADAAQQQVLLGLTGELVLLSGQADALVEAIEHGV
jgi:hypothetical protein